jgi:hypothetical protein
VCFALLKTCDFGFVHQVLTLTRVRPESRSTIAAEIHTYYAGMLQTLVRYGQDYLSREEFDACLEQHVSAYYRFLGKSVVFGRDKAFWDYHIRHLINAGIGFSRARVIRATLWNLCDAVLAPKNSIKKLIKRRAGQKLVHCEQDR